MSEVVEHRLIVAGSEVVWDEWSGGDELVVLLHGSGADASTWQGIAAKLAPARTVVALDRRGYGRSAHAPIGDHRIHRDDALAVIDSVTQRLNPSAVHLIGWSSGGVIALDMVAQRPSLATTVSVLEAPVHGVSGMTPGMVGLLAKVNLLTAVGRRKDAAAAFYRWAGGTTDGSNLFDEADDELRTMLLSYSDVIIRELRPSKVGSLGEHVDLSAVEASRVPVTWLLGARSIPFYRSRAEHARQTVPTIEIVEIAGATHVMHREKEADVLAVIETAMVRRRASA